jgi:hypothetical protein
MLKGSSRRHLLLGNGFSIALKHDIFSYGSLFENADFSRVPHVPQLFAALETTDFEIVIRYLLDAARVVAVYRPGMKRLIKRLVDDAEAVKDALVNVIASRHPSRPFDVSAGQYRACRAFLLPYDHIFTLNYDVLLYWTLMQDEVDELPLRHDDGFRHPEDRDLPYVSWQQGSSATVSYLHGALHLFDRRTEITKYTWSKTERAIVDQVREALDEDKYPIFVAEGTTASKQERILHNAYLHKALRSLEGCMQSGKSSVVIFGHSLAENDAHILRCVAAGSVPVMLVGLYGDPASAANQSVIENAEKLVGLRRKLRGERWPLDLHFYDAASARVWG